MSRIDLTDYAMQPRPLSHDDDDGWEIIRPAAVGVKSVCGRCVEGLRVVKAKAEWEAAVDRDREEAAELIDLEATLTGARNYISRRLPAFVATVEGLGELPVFLDMDGGDARDDAAAHGTLESEEAMGEKDRLLALFKGMNDGISAVKALQARLAASRVYENSAHTLIAKRVVIANVEFIHNHLPVFRAAVKDLTATERSVASIVFMLLKRILLEASSSPSHAHLFTATALDKSFASAAKVVLHEMMPAVRDSGVPWKTHLQDMDTMISAWGSDLLASDSLQVAMSLPSPRPQPVGDDDEEEEEEDDESFLDDLDAMLDMMEAGNHEFEEEEVGPAADGNVDGLVRENMWVLVRVEEVLLSCIKQMETKVGLVRLPRARDVLDELLDSVQFLGGVDPDLWDDIHVQVRQARTGVVEDDFVLL